VPPSPDPPHSEPTQVPQSPATAAGISTFDQGYGSGSQPPAKDGKSTAGRYRIIQPHAYGGLGEVFLARDGELGREVALKRIRPRRADDPLARRRFIAEAAVTARLEHPGIVPVHGLVEDADGRPAYAMRFIQGDTLADAIAKFHGPPIADVKKSAGEIILDAITGPAPLRFDALEFRQLLARFVTVCNAIAFAHSKGIIHRDLKPANVMLGLFGETLVVDWGLAKDLSSGDSVVGVVTEGTSADDSATQAGDILGTPSFMAPEQADGQPAGPAADVYGLGAILFTMLTGVAPVRGDTVEVLDRVRRGEVPSPRSVKPGVPRPLDAVCRKAMALQPGDRYDSALALAADVERWLADEPVSADREPLRERVRRWCRRHRTAVAASIVAVAASIVLLVTAVVGLTIANALISRQEAATAAAKNKAEEQRDRADRNLKLAAKAIDATANRISAHPKLQAGDFLDLRVELLTPLIPLFEELSRQTGDSPEVLFQRGISFGYLGGLRRDMGQTAQAERDYREYVLTFERLSARDPGDANLRRRLAQGHSDLGNVLGDLNRWPEARAELETAVRLERELVAADPAARQVLAVGLNGLAIAIQTTERPAAGEPLFREALGLVRTLLAQAPGDHTLITVCAGIENNLAILVRPTRPAEAEALYRSLIDRRTKLAAEVPTDRENRRQLVVGHFNLGNLLLAAKRIPEAEAEYRAMIGLAEKLVDEYESVPEYRSDLGRGLISLATVLANTNRQAEAVDVHRRTADLFAKLLTQFPNNAGYRRAAADNWYNLGLAYQDLNRPADAETAYRKAADDYGRLADDAPNDVRRTADVLETWATLGDLARSTGRLPEALGWYDKAVAKARGGPAKALRLKRARLLIETGDPKRAVADARELAADPTADGETLDGAARVLALAAPKATAEKDEYADEAVKLLRRAHDAGRYREPGSAKKLNEDADFAALRSRADFQSLVKGIAP
jgi:serine/threonine-protein kinase